LSNALTENDGHENDGPSKLQDMKLQETNLYIAVILRLKIGSVRLVRVYQFMRDLMACIGMVYTRDSILSRNEICDVIKFLAVN